MNKTGSNTGHLTQKIKVQKFNFLNFVIVPKTILEGLVTVKQMVLPFEYIYAC